MDLREGLRVIAHMKRFMLCLIGALVAWLSPALAEDASGETVRWLDFDKDVALPAAENCAVARSPDAAQGDGCLEITTPEPMQRVAKVTLELAPDLDLRGMRALHFFIRATPTANPIDLRWHACDAHGNELMQRKFSFDGGAVWTRFDLPLALWRWNNTFVGDWSEVKSLKFQIEDRVSQVRIDELYFEKGTRGAQSAYPSGELYDEIAFENRECRAVERGGYRIASDARDALNDKDINTLAARLTPLPVWLKRIFGDAHRPLNDQPIPILIFGKEEDYLTFVDRLGTALRVSIAEPGAGGYAIQDIASSYIDPEIGADRPVFFHEAVHATVARQLRLLPGAPLHSWMQEGLANYLQLCLFPESLKLETYERLFKEGIGDSTFFKPLSEILADKVELRHYAQLAVFTCWLATEKTDWLPKLARGLTAGKSAADVLTDLGTGFETVQNEWLRWGRATYKEGEKRERHFEVPPEWVTDESAD